MFLGRRSKSVKKMICDRDTEVMTRLMFAAWIMGDLSAREFFATLVELIVFWGIVKQVYMSILFEIVYYGILIAIQ